MRMSMNTTSSGSRRTDDIKGHPQDELPRVETKPLETQKASAVDPALHRSIVVRAEPVDHYLPTIRPVTEH